MIELLRAGAMSYSECGPAGCQHRTTAVCARQAFLARAARNARAGYAQERQRRTAALDPSSMLGDDFADPAAASSAALHVVYINTSLSTKAHAHATVPTIACTSSNVLPTLLAAFAQLPAGARVACGPDARGRATTATVTRYC